MNGNQDFNLFDVHYDTQFMKMGITVWIWSLLPQAEGQVHWGKFTHNKKGKREKESQFLLRDYDDTHQVSSV